MFPLIFKDIYMYDSMIFPFHISVCGCKETHEENGINLTLDDRRIGRDTPLIQYGTFSNMSINAEYIDEDDIADITTIN